jgi:S1-C subfamily serine protease
MLTIDLVVGLLLAAAAIAGAKLGAGRARPIAGAAAGILLGSRVPLLLGEELDSNYAVNIAVPAALVVGGIGAAVGETIARRTSRTLQRSRIVETALGAILSGAAAAVVVWALAPAVAEIRSVRDDVRRSEVLERFNAVLTPVRAPRDKPSSRPAPAGAPSRSADTKLANAVGDPRLRARPEVKRAQRSLVKIVSNRCGGGFQGTGWIAGHGIVVTNAHVVSASDRVTVFVQGRDPGREARVVWFDGIHDLALLRVNALNNARGIPLAGDARTSTAAATLGFPNGKLTIRHARLGLTNDKVRLPRLELASKAGISLTMKNRLVTVIYGLSGHGASGSPVINRRGDVVATVFAGITQTDITLAVPNRIVRSALRRLNHPVEVPACGDPPLHPTRKESLAARDA